MDTEEGTILGGTMEQEATYMATITTPVHATIMTTPTEVKLVNMLNASLLKIVYWDV